MLTLWCVTAGLSLYLTASRHTMSEPMIVQLFVALIILGAITATVSYLHLTYLSPLSKVRENISPNTDSDGSE